MSEINSLEELGLELAYYNKFLKSEEELLALANSPIKLEPLILKDGVPLIIKGTINAIGGHEGSHKSRLAESLASMLLSEKIANTPLGLDRFDNDEYKVLYLDTERNTKSEVPIAVRRVQRNVTGSNGSTFHPFSLKNTPRMNRLDSLKKMLQDKRVEFKNKHLVVFLDVITDCVSDFNDVKQSLILLDYLGEMAEDDDVTFFVVIHKNPSIGGKARGNVGSELMNKASTFIDITNKGREGIELEFKKTRHSRKPSKMLLKVDPTTELLVKMSEHEIRTSVQRQQNNSTLLIQALREIMPDCDTYYEQKHILNHLKEKLNISANTSKKRMQELSEKNSVFEDMTRLEITQESGKSTKYKRVLPTGEQTTNTETSH